MTKKAASKDVATDTKSKQKTTLPNLYKWNVWLAGLHAVQGIAVLLFSTTKVFPVQTNYLTLDPIASDFAGNPVLGYATRHLFDINLAYLVAVFFFMSAIAHAVVATVYRKRYEADLKKGINKARWIEYAFSASTMLVGIGLLSGVSDLAALKMIFVFGLVMNAMGLVMEVVNQGRNKVTWLPYIIGCIAGIMPWAVFAIYLGGAGLYGSGDIPAFVYWIYGSMLVLFSGFAVNMYLQYKKVGKWKDYLYGERMYMVLSLVAKTVLAWQIFGGTLRP
jgi:heliorhodopsin